SERPPGYLRNTVAPTNFNDWRAQNRSFQAISALSGFGASLTGSGEPEQLRVQVTDSAFFSVLGVQPMIGRAYTAEEEKPGSQVVILGYDIWAGRFGAKRDVVGSTIVLDGAATTVIGVMPPNFQMFQKADIWMPLHVPKTMDNRRSHILRVIGRLKDGLTIDQARADLSGIANQIAELSPETNKGWGVTIDPLHQIIVGDELRRTSLVLFGAVTFILLIACANVANLLLARGAARAREFAVRSSLGASGGRLFGMLLTESLLLAVTGGVLGVALAWTIVRVAPFWLPAGTLPPGIALGLDLRVLAFALGATLATGILFGAIPAWRAARSSAANDLRSGSRSVTSVGRFRSVLAGAEIAIAVVLVAGAGLMVRALWALQQVDPGFRTDNVLTMRLSLAPKRYTSPEGVRAFYNSLALELENTAGIKSAGFVTDLPLDGWSFGEMFQVAGQPDPGKASRPFAHFQHVSPGYFRTMGIGLARGRYLNEHDTAGGTPVCMVNEAFAKKQLQGKEPVGALVQIGDSKEFRQIVGVVRQVKVEGPGEIREPSEIYVPFDQMTNMNSSLAVRTAGDPMGMAETIKGVIRKIDKDQPIRLLRTMEMVASESVAQPRFRAQLLGSFAGVALLLAAVGTFGVMAFSVSQRTREFGIRMALGARGSQVLGQVLGGGLKIAAAGVAVGLALAFWLTEFLKSLLFGVTAQDPLTFIAAPVVLVVATAIPCLAPAIRATRVDPAIVLREE
ncbi:MAG: ABC transporter permease, partial [Bryobacteraceae bacterium]